MESEDEEGQDENRRYVDWDWENALEEAKQRWLDSRPTTYPQLPQTFATRDEDLLLPDLEKLFWKWHRRAEKNDSWITFENLPSLFRFALRRPLMPSTELVSILADFQLAKPEQGRPERMVEEQVKDGIRPRQQSPCEQKVDEKFKLPGSSHREPSHPKGKSNNNDKPSVSRQESDEIDTRILRKRLWGVYDDVQDGVIELEEAQDHYHTTRLEESPPDHQSGAHEPVDSDDLAQWLTSWGIPNLHIPTLENAPSLGPPSNLIRPEDPNMFAQAERTLDERRLIREIAKEVRLFRDPNSAVGIDACLGSLEEFLEGLRTQKKEISMLLEEYTLSSVDIAQEIWESWLSRTSTSSSEGGTCDEDDQSEGTLSSPGSECSLDSNGDSKESREEYIGKAYDDLLDDDESAHRIQSGKRRQRDQREEIPSPDTVLRSIEDAEDEEMMKEFEGDNRDTLLGSAGRPHPLFYDRDRLSPSPEDGVTTDLWGILMPTRKARSIASKLRLPSRRRIVSITKRRRVFAKTLKFKTNTVLSRAKRKASVSLHNNRPTKISRSNTPAKFSTPNSNADLFAMEDESPMDFIFSHVDPSVEGLVGEQPHYASNEDIAALPEISETREKVVKRARRQARENARTPSLPSAVPAFDDDFEPYKPLHRLGETTSQFLHMRIIPSKTACEEEVPIGFHMSRCLDEDRQLMWLNALEQSSSGDAWNRNALALANALLEMTPRLRKACENSNRLDLVTSLINKPPSSGSGAEPMTPEPPEDPFYDSQNYYPLSTYNRIAKNDKHNLSGVPGSMGGHEHDSKIYVSNEHQNESSTGAEDYVNAPESQSNTSDDKISDRRIPSAWGSSYDGTQASPRTPRIDKDNHLTLSSPKRRQRLFLRGPRAPNPPTGRDEKPSLPRKSPRRQHGNLPVRWRKHSPPADRVPLDSVSPSSPGPPPRALPTRAETPMPTAASSGGGLLLPEGPRPSSKFLSALEMATARRRSSSAGLDIESPGSPRSKSIGLPAPPERSLCFDAIDGPPPSPRPGFTKLAQTPMPSLFTSTGDGPPPSPRPESMKLAQTPMRSLFTGAGDGPPPISGPNAMSLPQSPRPSPSRSISMSPQTIREIQMQRDLNQFSTNPPPPPKPSAMSLPPSPQPSISRTLTMSPQTIREMQMAKGSANSSTSPPPSSRLSAMGLPPSPRPSPARTLSISPQTIRQMQMQKDIVKSSTDPTTNGKTDMPPPPPPKSAFKKPFMDRKKPGSSGRSPIKPKLKPQFQVKASDQSNKKLSEQVSPPYSPQPCDSSSSSDSSSSEDSSASDYNLPRRADKMWSSMGGDLGIEYAYEYAREQAGDKQQSFQAFIEARRAVRDRLIRKQAKFDKKADKRFQARFFQGSNGPSGSSTASSLNKLFDKYRDDAAEEPDRIAVEGSMRYLQDLGLKLDEPVLLAVLTELGAPTMGEFTREGFLNGWTNLRYGTKYALHSRAVRWDIC